MKVHEVVERKIMTRKIKRVYCNKCGKKINKFSNRYIDFLDVKKRWNFLSRYDNEIHTFQLCQKCYSEFIGQFKIPIDHKK